MSKRIFTRDEKRGGTYYAPFYKNECLNEEMRTYSARHNHFDESLYAVIISDDAIFEGI